MHSQAGAWERGKNNNNQYLAEHPVETSPSIEHFVTTKLHLLTTHNAQIESAIELLATGISSTEQYHKIAEPNFAATENIFT